MRGANFRSVALARRWVRAAKPASWPKLLVPALLGQAMGLGIEARFSFSALLFGFAFTVLDLLFVVFLNDWGDREVDAIKRGMFPRSGGLKTIPDGILPARHLRVAGTIAGAGALGVAGAAELALDRPGLFALGVVALGLFVAYTLPPLRLNYRGGGELLEMLGVGVLLPWLHAYLQGGEIFAAPLALLPGLALLALGSAIASGLADERSDRRGGKRTFATRFGNAPTRRAVELSTFAGALAWTLAGVLDALPAVVTIAPALVVAGYGASMLPLSAAARTDAFDAQRRYKERLHHAIWRGSLAAAVALALWRLVFPASH